MEASSRTVNKGEDAAGTTSIINRDAYKQYYLFFKDIEKDVVSHIYTLKSYNKSDLMKYLTILQLVGEESEARTNVAQFNEMTRVYSEKIPMSLHDDEVKNDDKLYAVVSYITMMKVFITKSACLFVALLSVLK